VVGFAATAVRVDRGGAARVPRHAHVVSPAEDPRRGRALGPARLWRRARPARSVDQNLTKNRRRGRRETARGLDLRPDAVRPS
jgi:hypothetical protein